MDYYLRILRRRIRLIRALQSSPRSRYELATALRVTDKTVQRDLVWLVLS